jgi:PAS domain S-box-containing protein
MDDTKSLKKEIESLKLQVEELRTQLSGNEQQENLYRIIFESSQLSNKIITRDLEISKVNPALVTLLGYDDKDEIIGTKILDYAPDDHKKHWAVLQKELWEKQKPYFKLETSLIKKDKSVIWVQVTSILIKEQTRTLGYTILEEITDQYFQKLKKEEFIDVASHELKTPITTLRTILQLMNRKITEQANFPEQILKLAKNAEVYTAKLTTLVGDLLNLSNFEQGEVTIKKTTFHLSEVTKKCCSHIEAEGIYELVFQGDHSLMIHADKNKIEQVIVNFVNNAVRYAPESKKIVIKVETLKTFTRISVIDQGQGIAAEHIPHLFERYYRVSRNTDRSGLGLGLYISAGIIRSHDGEIGVKSKPGEGSAFWFTIPTDD